MIPTLLVKKLRSCILEEAADTFAADFCSEKMLRGWAEDKDNTYTPDKLLDTYIDLYNECLTLVPRDMHVGLHICRGEFYCAASLILSSCLNPEQATL